MNIAIIPARGGIKRIPGKNICPSADVLIVGADAMPVVLPRHLVRDIDTKEDWRRVKLTLAALRLTGEINE